MIDSLLSQQWKDEDFIVALAVVMKETGHSDEILAKIASPDQLKAARVLVARWAWWHKTSSS